MRDDSQKTSRDGLNEYIRVGSPGLLVVIAALSLVLVATVVWGFTGKIPITLTNAGCVVDSDIAIKVQNAHGGAPDEGSNNAWVVCFADSSKYSAAQIMKFEDDVAILMPDGSSFEGRFSACRNIR